MYKCRKTPKTFAVTHGIEELAEKELTAVDFVSSVLTIAPSVTF